MPNRETKWIAKTPNYLPDNITCELWHEGGLAGIVQEIEIHRFSVQNEGRASLKAFTGTAIIKSIPKEMLLTSIYTMKTKCNDEILNTYEFRFVGETPSCYLLNELPGYPEQIEYPVAEGEKYEFFAREK